MGSVKDLTVISDPAGTVPGKGRFVFSDRYSVFDWGEMPDLIENKGRALCIMGAYFFEKLQDAGVRTHYRGLVEGDRSKPLSELQEASNVMEVDLFRVIKPAERIDGYDYSAFRNESGNFLIPLEIIYRNSLPEGSSVFRRLKEGSLSPADIGLEEVPSPGVKLSRPVLDFSTKLEPTDRYLRRGEAAEIAGLSESELQEIIRITLQVNDLITAETARAGLFHEDGKIEYAFDGERNPVLVDVLGTPDECRFTFEGMPVSKEVARIFYRGTSWYREVEEVKKKDRVGWKKLVFSAPPLLPERLKELISMLYTACCNEITGSQWFDVPPLKKVLQELKEVMEREISAP